MGKTADYKPIEETPLFMGFAEVARTCWELVESWPIFAKDTLGKQLIRAIDSVGANLVEGDGRYRDTDALHFFVIARASTREAAYWIRLAEERELIQPDTAASLLGTLQTASRELNGFITYRRNHLNVGKVKEEAAVWCPEDSATEG